MANEVRLPQLGQTMEDGTIVSYCVNVGDEVKKGDVIFEVETDKATLEVESPANGFVKEILVEIGKTLPVNAPIIVLGEKDEKVTKDFVDSLKAEIISFWTQTTDVPPKPDSDVFVEPQDLLTPGKSEATERQISLGRTVPLSRLKKIVGQRMLQSKREIPCFYLSAKADVTELVALRNKLNRTGNTKIAYHDFIVKATALALKQYPIMTGKLVDDYIQLPKSINIGLAIDVADGLVAPVVKDADEKGLAQIALESAGLAEKARSNKLSLLDLEGGCITLSNLGSFGTDSVIPIVMPGQCSVLGIGRITDSCVPEDGNPDSIGVRKMMNLTLSVDHRTANGAYAAQFLDYLRRLLQEPAALV